MKKCRICGDEFDKSVYGKYVDLCERKECFHKAFWNRALQLYLDGDKTENGNLVARIDGHHYIIGDEDDSPSLRGFAGREFNIVFIYGPHKDKKVTTTNLWYSGEIPEEYASVLVDNAIFI